MKTKNLMRTTFLLLSVIAASIYLSTFSGCRIYVPLAEIRTPCDLLFYEDGPAVNLIIVGPDVLKTCSSQESYTALLREKDVDDWVIPMDNMAEWVVSGDIKIVGSNEANPVTIQGTKLGGIGTLTLMVKDLDDCPNSGKILGTTTIIVSFQKLDINSTVCKDASNIGAGVITIIDSATKVPITDIDESFWSVFPAGSAMLDPQADNVSCKVSQATGDFTVTVKLGQKGNCISDPQSFDITIPTCEQQ